MTEIRPDLRALIIRARKNPFRWGKPKGLSQADVAARASTSQVWVRQIETGYTRTAKADTLGNICYVLSIPSEIIRDIGYPDVADAIDAAAILDTEPYEPDTPQHHDGDGVSSDAVQHIKSTPGLSEQEKEQLVDALHNIHREEPLGRDIWRRK